MSNVTAVPPAPASDLRKALDGIKRALPEHMELIAIAATETFAEFKALKAAGFNETQAMQLLCAKRMRVAQ